MEFGKKILIGALAAVLAYASGGYALYKKFEDHPHTFREIIRWPNNEMATRCDELGEEYKRLKEKIKPKTVEGKVNEIQKSYRYIHSGPYIIPTPIFFINLDDGKTYYYDEKDFWMKERDKVRLKVFDSAKPSEVHAFLRKVREFRKEHHGWRWTTRDYENVLSKKIRDYEVLKEEN